MATTRIFVDAHVFDGEHQGTRTFIRELYTRLAQRPDVELLLAAASVENLEQVFGQRDNVRFLAYRSHGRVKRLGLEIPALLRRYRPDFAHFQYVTPPLKIGKYLVTTHDLLFKDFPGEFPLSYRLSKSALFRASLGLADVVTTVSEYSRQAIHRHFGIRPERIHVTPNGVSERFAEPFDAAVVRQAMRERFGVENYILYVSRIEPRKRQAALLRAYLDAGLYRRGVSLVFIGHESLPDPELIALREAMPATARSFVYFFKQIGDDDLLDFYRAATLFAYPSAAEGFGIPPLEAGALGIPTLCSDATAMQDFDFFGEGHFPPTVENLKTRLANFFDGGSQADPATLRRIADQIRERYSWERSAHVLHHLLTS
jgi:glycosyltransferase involved in cell wall biosynthesis